jgi:hypothetical protein
MHLWDDCFFSKISALSISKFGVRYFHSGVFLDEKPGRLKKNLPGFRSRLSASFRRSAFRNSVFGVRYFQFAFLLAKKMSNPEFWNRCVAPKTSVAFSFSIGSEVHSTGTNVLCERQVSVLRTSFLLPHPFLPTFRVLCTNPQKEVAALLQEQPLLSFTKCVSLVAELRWFA